MTVRPFRGKGVSLVRVTPRNEAGQLVFLKKKKNSSTLGELQLQSQEAEDRVRHPIFPGPPGGARPLKTASPFLRGSPGRRGCPEAGALVSRLLKPFPFVREAPWEPAVRPAQPPLAPRPPGAQREGGAGLQPPPRRRGRDPREFGPPRCGSVVPSLPGPPRSPLSACAGLSLRRANTAQRAEPRGARRAAARAAGSRRGRSPRSSCGPTDARTMAAEGPGPGARLWAAALLLLGLPRLSTPANGECPWSVHEAAGPGWLIGSRWGKRSSPGLPPGTSPEHGQLGRERGEWPSCHPASPLPAPRVASGRNAPWSPSTTPSCGARTGESLCFDLTALPLAFQDLEKSAK